MLADVLGALFLHAPTARIEGSAAGNGCGPLFRWHFPVGWPPLAGWYTTRDQAGQPWLVRRVETDAAVGDVCPCAGAPLWWPYLVIYARRFCGYISVLCLPCRRKAQGRG